MATQLDVGAQAHRPGDANPAPGQLGIQVERQPGIGFPGGHGFGKYIALVTGWCRIATKTDAPPQGKGSTAQLAHGNRLAAEPVVPAAIAGIGGGQVTGRPYVIEDTTLIPV